MATYTWTNMGGGTGAVGSGRTRCTITIYVTDNGNNTLTYQAYAQGTLVSSSGTYIHYIQYVGVKYGDTAYLIGDQRGSNSGKGALLGSTSQGAGSAGNVYVGSVTLNKPIEGTTITMYGQNYINDGNSYYYTGSWNLDSNFFQATTFTLTLNKDNGFSSTTGGGSYEEGTTVNINATIKSGYTWSEWTGSTSYLTSDVTTKSNSVKMPATAVTLKANSIANTYTANWDGNGGTSSVASNTVTFNSTYTLPTATRAGHTFKGWYTAASGGTQITASTKHTTTGDVTYYAQWTPWTFTVKYEKNTGEGSMSDSSHTHATASTLTVCTFEKPGYSFLGWNTAADGSGNQYADNDDALVMAIKESITNGGSITLYAQWGIKGIKFYHDGEWVIGRVKIFTNGTWY